MDELSYFKVISQYKLMAKKEIGQNFLVDPNICRNIVKLIPNNTKDKVLEIGCGAGSLTYFLKDLENKVTSIDIDESMLLKVKEDFSSYPNLKIEYGNAADYDYSPYQIIIGNLPYYITSLIIEKVIQRGRACKFAIFMVQKEVLNRLLAKPNSKDYGPLNILISLVGNINKEFNVSRNCFVPIPNVDSSVFSITFNDGVDRDKCIGIYSLVCKLFLERRKTLTNNLKKVVDSSLVEKIFKELEIDKNIRPEQVSPEMFRNIYELIHKNI